MDLQVQWKTENFATSWTTISFKIRKWPLSSSFLYRSTALVDLGHIFSFSILYTTGRTTWTGDQPVARTLPTHIITQTQNKHTQAFMSCVGFEPTIPVFERAKTFHALDCTETAVGKDHSAWNFLSYLIKWGSQDSSVGIATGYVLDEGGVGVWVSVVSRIFFSPHRPDWLRGSPSFLSNGYRDLFPRG
jgi:hypothetical protein